MINAPELLTVLEDGFGATRFPRQIDFGALRRVKLGEKSRKRSALNSIMLIGERRGGDLFPPQPLSLFDLPVE